MEFLVAGRKLDRNDLDGFENDASMTLQMKHGLVQLAISLMSQTWVASVSTCF